jgi:hypothetical protein
LNIQFSITNGLNYLLQDLKNFSITALGGVWTAFCWF